MIVVKNKITALILALTLIIPSFCVLSSAESLLLGDVDLNGVHTASDARAVLRFSANLEKPDETALKAADANKDGSVTASDARMILRWSAKLETGPTVEQETGFDAEPGSFDGGGPGMETNDYPASIDAFFAGDFYLEAVDLDQFQEFEGSVALAVKDGDMEAVIPVNGLNVCVLVMDERVYVKTENGEGDRYYADFTPYLKAAGIETDFSELVSALDYSSVGEYEKPVKTSLEKDGVLYDVYTFTETESKVAFYCLNGEVKGLAAFNDDGTLIYDLKIQKLSEKIPENMLTLDGFQNDIHKVVGLMRDARSE